MDIGLIHYCFFLYPLVLQCKKIHSILLLFNMIFLRMYFYLFLEFLLPKLKKFLEFCIFLYAKTPRADAGAEKINSGSWCPAAATVAESEDLLAVILLRLPAKSLMKFKCVCKQWLLLISSPQFTITHSRIHNSSPCALLLSKGFKCIDEFQVVPLKSSASAIPSFNFIKVNRLKILQSCNGLLLCRSCFSIQPNILINHVINGFVYSVWNPTTGQSKTLCFPFVQTSYLISVGLAFDPSSSPHYKIVFIFDLSIKGPETYLVNIFTYSSETNSWNSKIANVIGLRMDYLVPPTLGIGFQDGVYCNNGIHWLRCGRKTSLLCFSFDDWTMKKLDLPMELSVRYFGVSPGNLQIVDYKYTIYQVVEIAPDYSKWVVKYRVNLQHMKEELWILSIIEEQVIISCKSGDIMSCNLKDGSFKKIYVLDRWVELYRGRLNCQGDSINYFESIVCI